VPWYDHFFHGLVQEAWKAAQTEEQTQFKVDFLHDTLQLQAGHRVLDIFCGYGRHALELARQGCQLTGVDLSAESIAELRAEAARHRLPVEAIEGDFITVALPGSFDAAYCFGNSFSFFPRAEMLAFLRRIADQLRPGGLFAADTGMAAESVLPDFQERSWMQLGEITFLMENEYSATESRIDSHLTYLRGGQTEQRTARHYLDTCAELVRLFQEAGFEVTDCLGSLEGDPFTLGDDRLLLLARRTR